VLAGADRDDVTALVFPDLDACRNLIGGLAADAAAADVLMNTRVRTEFARRLDTLAWTSSGTSNRITRAILLAEPPSLDIGEMTDKGSINQRAVLAHRAALVDKLYAEMPSPEIIAAGAAQTAQVN
jgi:feruloyl-CoA synthase